MCDTRAARFNLVIGMSEQASEFEGNRKRAMFIQVVRPMICFDILMVFIQPFWNVGDDKVLAAYLFEQVGGIQVKCCSHKLDKIWTRYRCPIRQKFRF